MSGVSPWRVKGEVQKGRLGGGMWWLAGESKQCQDWGVWLLKNKQSDINKSATFTRRPINLMLPAAGRLQRLTKHAIFHGFFRLSFTHLYATQAVTLYTRVLPFDCALLLYARWSNVSSASASISQRIQSVVLYDRCSTASLASARYAKRNQSVTHSVIQWHHNHHHHHHHQVTFLCCRMFRDAQHKALPLVLLLN